MDIPSSSPDKNALGFLPSKIAANAGGYSGDHSGYRVVEEGGRSHHADRG